MWHISRNDRCATVGISYWCSIWEVQVRVCYSVSREHMHAISHALRYSSMYSRLIFKVRLPMRQLKGARQARLFTNLQHSSYLMVMSHIVCWSRPCSMKPLPRITAQSIAALKVQHGSAIRVGPRLRCVDGVCSIGYICGGHRGK